MRKE
jgi:hypothetical protein